MSAVTQTDSRNFLASRYEYVTQISTDGLKGYPEAVDLAFGPYAKFGTIIKDYKNANITMYEYDNYSLLPNNE